MNKLSEIKNRKYTGYIWMSDAKKPKMLNDEVFDFTSIDVNPFIIEALLYNKEEKISLTIRHTGEYHIKEIDLNNLPDNAKLEDVEYLPHRLESVNKVCFKQLWLPEADENCEKFEVLKMKALVFVGFDCKTKN